jgi:hypothetical protein
MKILVKSTVSIIAFLFSGMSLFAQTKLESKKNTPLIFIILDYGIVKATGIADDPLKASPTGTHHWLDDLQVVKVTDSIPLKLKQNFGFFYVIKTIDTVNLNIDTEWIYPSKITNEKGESYKSIKYTIPKTTNIPSASLYSLDEPYEMVKGKWVVNLYMENKKIGSKSFIVY